MCTVRKGVSHPHCWFRPKCRKRHYRHLPDPLHMLSRLTIRKYTTPSELLQEQNHSLGIVPLSAAVSLTRVIRKRGSFQETRRELVTKVAFTQLGNKIYLTFTTVDIAQSAQCPAVTGVCFVLRNGRNMKPTRHCFLLARFWLRGSLPPCRHMSLFRGALLCAYNLSTSHVAN